jgi:hypothetical protein
MRSWVKRAERLFWFIVIFGPVAAFAAALIVYVYDWSQP